MKFDLLQYLFSLSIIYVYVKLILHYGPIFIHYMVNQEIVWKPVLIRPTILFSFVGLGFMHLVVYNQEHLNGKSYFLQGIMIAVFGSSFFLSQIPWTKRFKKNFLTEKKITPQPENNHFNFKISELQIQQLYNDLVRHDLLSSDKTSIQDFQNVLTTKWDSHTSRIYFNLDGPSCREFHTFLVKTFPANSSTLKSFFETSGLILRSSGKAYKYNTVKNAPTRTPVSKHHETLINIFNKLK